MSARDSGDVSHEIREMMEVEPAEVAASTGPNKLPDDFFATLTRAPRYRNMRRRDDPHRSDLQQCGWLWLCPLCHRAVRILYCPIRQITLPEYLGEPWPLSPAGS